MRIRLPFLLLLVLPLAGCISASRARPVQKESRYLITQEQIQASNRSTAMDVVRAARPEWLRRRGVDSLMNPSSVVVYVDHTRMGGPEVLNAIGTHMVSSIRWLSSSEATSRWGTGHASGAILVLTRH